jgi:hypothetical protein
MVIGGAIIAIMAHIALPLGVMLAAGALAASGLADTKPQVFIDEHVVEARFVRLGEKRDPDRLPSRIVPRKSTAPDNSPVVSKDMNPPEPEKKEKPPEDPEIDDLTRIGDRAKDFAEIVDHEIEGDPDGVDFGTETEAREGDIYRGKLVEFFRRGWTVPTTLTDPSKLRATATVEITTNLKVGPSQIIKSSGEPLFDQSIEDRFQELRTLGTTLPEPPPEIADTVLGREMVVNFSGDQFD